MSTAVPKLVQRFRARELQKLANAGGYVKPPSQFRPPYAFMKDTDTTNIRMEIPLHNPFLPRPRTLKSLKPSKSTETGEGQGKMKMMKQRKTWKGPQYSLRRQVELVKAARASGTLHLLPPGPKLSVDELEAAKKEYRMRATKAKATSAKIEQLIRERPASESLSQPLPTETDTLISGTLTAAATVKKGCWRRRSNATLIRRRNSAALGYPGIVFRWTGKVPEKKRVGLTFYAGRRRMFKGHKWERHLGNRKGEIAVRMRDMGARIARFKNVYKRRRPQPLKPAPSKKKESLPF